MDTSVARLQPEGVLRFQSVPPLLPAYNKFMGEVDRNDQFRMMYGCDKKLRHYWLRLFFQFFDYAVNNAYFLYKYNYIARNIYPKDLLGFRLELVHVLLKVVGSKSGSTCAVSRVCTNESHAVFHGPALSVQLKRSYRLHASIKAYFVGKKL